MKSRVGIIILAVIAIMSAKPALADLTSQVFPRDSVVFARVYGDWSAAWWQWVLSIPVDSNPLLDNTVDCNTGQSGPVFFLAGNAGGTSERSCTVPSGKALFFPVLNQVFASFPPPPRVTVINDLRASNAAAMDTASGMEVDLDGQQLSNDQIKDDFRVTSVAFDVTLPSHNLFHIAQGVFAVAVDDGYYVMLEPLTPGTHKLEFKGTSGSGFTLDVTYNLTQQ